MQITDSDFTRPKDEYSSYFGRPYDGLVVSDDQTTANMDPWEIHVLSFTSSFMINARPLVGCLKNSDRKVKQFCVLLSNWTS